MLVSHSKSLDSRSTSTITGVKNALQDVLAAGRRVLGVFTKGDFKGRMYECLKGADGKIMKGSIKMLGEEVKLKDVGKKVSGDKEVEVDGVPKLKRWSSYKDLENGEFIAGTYRETLSDM